MSTSENNGTANGTTVEQIGRLGIPARKALPNKVDAPPPAIYSHMAIPARQQLHFLPAPKVYDMVIPARQPLRSFVPAPENPKISPNFSPLNIVPGPIQISHSNTIGAMPMPTREKPKLVYAGDMHNNTTTGNTTYGGNTTTGNLICWTYGNVTGGNTTGNITCRPMVGLGSQLFGIASFCNSTTARDCANIPIRQCPSCSIEEASFFLAYVLLLGILILVGNLYVLWTTYEEKRKLKLTYIKSSMAVADILNGVYLLATVAPNVLWTLDLTVNELDKKQLEMSNTPSSVASATYFLLINTSATFQVTLLSLIQLYVITRPLKSRSLTVKIVLLLIGLTWLAALACSTMPAWMPDAFEYTYQHYLFIYSYALRWNAPKLKYLVIVLLRTWIPYTIMALATLLMYISVRKQLRKSHSLTKKKQQIAKKERNITKIVLYMELGFAITTVPYVVMSIVFNQSDRNHNKDLKLKLLMIFIYLYLSRSLVNIVVYLLRDKDFRKSLSRRLAIRSSTYKYSSTSTTTPAEIKSTTV